MGEIKEAKGVRLDMGTARWRKSTRSGPISDNCVEVAEVEGGVALRDSKDAAGPVLLFTDAEWSAFAAGMRDGEFPG
jgi:hypothetical protein